MSLSQRRASLRFTHGLPGCAWFSLSLALLACGGEGGSDSGLGPSTGAESSSSTSTLPPSGESTGTSSTQADSTGAESTEGSSTTGDPGGDVLGPDAIARIEEAVGDTLGTGYATGCSVAIWRDGSVIYAGGFGTKNAAREPVSPDTLFQIGSDTKKMTAIALLREVDAGTADLDTTVADILPTLDLAASPGTFDTLTIDRLLSHRSGLYDYTPWDDAPDDGELLLRTSTAFAANEYAMMPPGVAWNYSNPNFSLAGLLTEQLAERAWAEVLIDDVAAPLDMTHTYARRDDMLAAETDIASGFGPIPGSDFNSFELLEVSSTETGPADWTSPEDHADNAFTRPAGLVWGTATDMAKLAGFLIAGDEAVLSNELREQLMTGQVALAPGLDPTEFGYGYGVTAVRGLDGPQGYRDVRLVQHGGNTLDMTSTFIMLPEQQVAVSILSNGFVDNMDIVAAVALEEAAAGRLPDPSAPPRVGDPPAADLSVYAGTFYDTALGEVSITWTGAQLQIDIPTLTDLGVQVEPTMTAVARDVFLVSVDGGEFDLSFYPDLNGEPNHYAVNRSFVLDRTEAESSARRPRPAGRGAPINLTRQRPLAPPRWR